MSEPRTGREGLLKPVIDNRWVLLVVRIALGGLLITSAVSKFQDMDAFREALLAYGMLPHSLGVLYAAVLPWVELLIGCCLILGVFVLFASSLTIPLVLSFTIANVYAMVHPIGGAADCSCLGSLVRMSHPVSLSVDFAMMLAAGLLLAGRRKAGAVSLGWALERLPLGLSGRTAVVLKVSLVGILMVGIGAAVPARGALEELGVDDALELGRPVLVYVYEENADLAQDAAVLSHIEVSYSQVFVVRLRYSDARSEVRDLGVETVPSLLVISGKSHSGGYAVAGSFDCPLNEEEVTRLVSELVSR